MIYQAELTPQSARQCAVYFRPSLEMLNVALAFNVIEYACEPKFFQLSVAHMRLNTRREHLKSVIANSLEVSAF
jgi:hypothetical protein